jgi:hypothetical protein
MPPRIAAIPGDRLHPHYDLPSLTVRCSPAVVIVQPEAGVAPAEEPPIQCFVIPPLPDEHLEDPVAEEPPQGG